MNLLSNAKLLFLILTGFVSLSGASQIYGKGNDGKIMSIEGYISDEPRVFTSKDGKYESYSFRMNARESHTHGDEFISVSFQTVKLGKKIADFQHKKGDKVKLSGKYSEFKGNPKSGIVGSLKVNGN